MTFSIKALRVNRSLSEETLCFSATLYLNRRRVGHLKNRGHGGETEIEFSSKLAETDALNAAVHLHPATSMSASDATTHEQWRFLHDQLDWLVGETYQTQQYKDWCRHKTVFRSKDQPDGEWRQINAKYSEKVATYIRDQYPDTVEILNERFTK